MFGIDLAEIFQPDTPVLETFLRGTVMYLSVFVLLRVIVKQAAGGLNLADLLLVVLIADAAQNGMAGEYTAITDGLILVATLAFWSLALDWLGFHFEFAGRFLHPDPVELVRNGIENRRQMRRELISHEELMTHVRKAGSEDISQVRRAWVEGNGEISVVLQDDQPTSRSPDERQIV
jgi:uncharacterized membrane protein YcaP (DUF421 family)